MFQLTVTYNAGITHINFAYSDTSRKPHTRKVRRGLTYLQVIAWCAKHGMPMGHGWPALNCQV